MNSFDRTITLLLILAVTALLILLDSCTLPSVTVHGQYGDYTFKPRQPITVEPSK
jgi:hypothetical protein